MMWSPFFWALVLEGDRLSVVKFSDMETKEQLVVGNHDK